MLASCFQAYDSSGMTESQLRVLSDLSDYGLVYRTSVSFLSPLLFAFRNFQSFFLSFISSLILELVHPALA